MTTDADIIYILDSQREAAQQIMRTPFELGSGPDPRELVRAALDAHPDFAESSSVSFLGRYIGFSNNSQAMNLLRMSVDRGGLEALRWYRRVRATRTAGVRVVALVHGLWVETAVSLSTGVRIVSVYELPNYRTSLAARFAPDVFARSNAAAVFEIGCVEGVTDQQQHKGHEQFLAIVENIREAITASTLSEHAAPTVAEAWVEFVDPEIEAASIGHTWQMSRHDGRHAHHPTTLDEDMIAWIETYLKLPPKLAAACRVPLQRLNLARRRVNAGDKAIDGCIGLEALLSGTGSGDLMHKLSIRTALLLGKDLTERREIKKNVKDFYAVRSGMVHGRSGQAKDEQSAKEGLRLLLLAIRAVIGTGVVPDPEEWELTGGPPHNRFHV